MQHKIIIISGDKNSGKTRLMYAICSLLDFDGYSIGGMIQVPTLPGHFKTTYTLSDQLTGHSEIILNDKEKEGCTPYKNFYIDNSAFLWANEQIIQAMEKSDYLLFDEVGMLELQKKGFYPSLIKALKGYKGIIMMAVRDTYVEEVIQNFSIDRQSVLIIPSTSTSDEAYRMVSSHE
ncbi:MAG: hypothetical protein EOM67_02815 [Spirochaetia bacterium]|nr:hypothetical protein [Spirochaetia bacterium]